MNIYEYFGEYRNLGRMKLKPPSYDLDQLPNSHVILKKKTQNIFYIFLTLILSSDPKAIFDGCSTISYIMDWMEGMVSKYRVPYCANDIVHYLFVLINETRLSQLKLFG